MFHYTFTFLRRNINEKGMFNSAVFVKLIISAFVYYLIGPKKEYGFFCEAFSCSEANVALNPQKET